MPLILFTASLQIFPMMPPPGRLTFSGRLYAAPPIPHLQGHLYRLDISGGLPASRLYGSLKCSPAILGKQIDKLLPIVAARRAVASQEVSHIPNFEDNGGVWSDINYFASIGDLNRTRLNR